MKLTMPSGDKCQTNAGRVDVALFGEGDFGFWKDCDAKRGDVIASRFCGEQLKDFFQEKQSLQYFPENAQMPNEIFANFCRYCRALRSRHHKLKIIYLTHIPSEPIASVHTPHLTSLLCLRQCSPEAPRPLSVAILH